MWVEALWRRPPASQRLTVELSPTGSDDRDDIDVSVVGSCAVTMTPVLRHLGSLHRSPALRTSGGRRETQRRRTPPPR